jgi:hypothetical protein
VSSFRKRWPTLQPDSLLLKIFFPFISLDEQAAKVRREPSLNHRSDKVDSVTESPNQLMGDLVGNHVFNFAGNAKPLT